MKKVMFGVLAAANAAFVPFTFPALATLTLFVLTVGVMVYPVADLLEVFA